MSDTPKVILPTRTVEDMARLYALLDEDAEYVPGAEIVHTHDVPRPFRQLLSHEKHMTVTLEKFIGAPVHVAVLKQNLVGQSYTRKILLSDSQTARIVQFGIMRFNFDHCADAVRDRILEGKTPLGRILIESHVLRRISTHALLRIQPNAEIMDAFDLEEPEAVYGRLATIFCNEEPAVDLLEIVAPNIVAAEE